MPVSATPSCARSRRRITTAIWRGCMARRGWAVSQFFAIARSEATKQSIPQRKNGLLGFARNDDLQTLVVPALSRDPLSQVFVVCEISAAPAFAQHRPVAMGPGSRPGRQPSVLRRHPLNPHHRLPVDLAGAGLRQLLDEFYLARIFVR